MYVTGLKNSVAATVAGMVLTVCATLIPRASAQMPVTKVVVSEARVLDAPATTNLIGTVNPVRRSRVASRIAGLVVSLPVREGDYVEAGQLLCKLDDVTLQLELQEATATYEAFGASYDELKAGTRPQELKRLKAFVDEATADFERWKLELDRVEKLYIGSDSNAKERYDTRADFLRAERRMVASQAAYDLGVEGPRLEQVAKAAFEKAAQKAVVDRIQSDLDKTEILAPFSGFISGRNTEVGEWIPIGGEVLELVDLSSVLVRVSAPETTWPFLAVGKPVRVTIDALMQTRAQPTFWGTVKHVTPQADLTARTFPVDVEIDNSERVLASGMFARAGIPSGVESKVVAVPKDAIVERDGIAHVAAVHPASGGGIVGILMPVTVGSGIGEWIAITSDNVQPGLPIITHGNEHILPFPTPVVIVDEKGTPVKLKPNEAQRDDASHASEGHG